MQRIQLETLIEAPADRVFDLSRSIDAHMSSTGRSNEIAVAGRVAGLIELGETVTWEATHLCVRQRLTSRIVEMDRPRFFVDEMVTGAFQTMYHVHRFDAVEGGTLMLDDFSFSAPFGPLGRMVELVFLRRYMMRFLSRRNACLKALAESEEWKPFLV